MAPQDIERMSSRGDRPSGAGHRVVRPRWRSVSNPVKLKSTEGKLSTPWW
jgi:hypothetical protein